MTTPTLMRAAALFAAVLGLTPAANAAPIAFTQTGMASGSLNGTAFTNQPVTLRVTGNTNDVVLTVVEDVNVSLSVNSNIVTTVSIPGFPLALITQPTAIYAFPFIPDSIDVDDELPNLPFVLFATLDDPPDVLGFTGLGLTASNQLAGYDLRSSIGPITGSGGVDYALTETIMTDRGPLRFTSRLAESDQGTFTATASVPEPTSLLLLASGLVTVFAGRARARSRA